MGEGFLLEGLDDCGLVSTSLPASATISWALRACVTNVKEFVIREGMAAKNLEELLERVRHWPKERQEDAAEVLLEMERQDTTGYRLTDAQAQEVVHIRAEIREGKATFATDEQMAALWKSCGL
jgi:hypothetical protein